MTPEEKWERINNPKTVEDYGLFLTESEMRQFPEGRKLLLAIKIRQREVNSISRNARKMGENARIFIDNLIFKVLMGNNNA